MSKHMKNVRSNPHESVDHLVRQKHIECGENQRKPLEKCPDELLPSHLGSSGTFLQSLRSWQMGASNQTSQTLLIELGCDLN